MSAQKHRQVADQLATGSDDDYEWWFRLINDDGTEGDLPTAPPRNLGQADDLIEGSSSHSTPSNAEALQIPVVNVNTGDPAGMTYGQPGVQSRDAEIARPDEGEALRMRLEDLLELHGDGIPVVWPPGFDPLTARQLVLTSAPPATSFLHGHHSRGR